MLSIDNPLVKMALNTFISRARKDGVRHILVTIPETGDPLFDAYNEPIKVLTESEVQTIKKHIENGNNNNNDNAGQPASNNETGRNENAGSSENSGNA